MNPSFNKKKAIVLGGTHGLGRAIAEMLLKNGAEVVIAGKDKMLVDEVTKELTPYGKVIGHVLDLLLDYDVDLFIEELDGYLNGEIDFLINAAGFFKVKAFNETSVSDYDALLDLNRGFFFITQEVAKKMGTTGGGAILNISSFLSRQAVRGIQAAAFSMAKAGLEAFTRQLSIELAPSKIRVNAISIGILENGTFYGGKWSEIVDIVSFLLSGQASYVNGAVWEVDAGLFAGRL
jgi:NAD(P)-dependent dehydrogenase (short-subunit alcohol dehydrogenase family)